MPAQGIPVNAYNPMDYANLKVSTEVSELFQYISRYHPHNIELDSKFKPFIPEYIPAVGEVDAFLKVPRPDNGEEGLGLVYLVKLIMRSNRMNQRLTLLIHQSSKCSIYRRKNRSRWHRCRCVLWSRPRRTRSKSSNGSTVSASFIRPGRHPLSNTPRTCLTLKA